MNKDIAIKWTEALRSGKYKQGRGLLKQIDKKGQFKHCCLGVLCELYNKDRKKKKKKALYVKDDILSCPLTGKVVEGFSFDGDDQLLPYIVREWAGLDSSNGEVFIGGKFFDLAELNDSGKKFSTIANFIEKNVEIL